MYLGWVTEQVWRENVTDSPEKPVSYVNLFTVCMIAGTLYLLWTTNMQATWIKGMVYSGIVWAAIYGIIRLFHVKMGGIRQVTMVLFGIVFTVGMMEAKGQAWMRDLVGFEVLPLGLVSNTTGQIVLTPFSLSAILLGLLLFGILLNKRNLKEAFE